MSIDGINMLKLKLNTVKFHTKTVINKSTLCNVVHFREVVVVEWFVCSGERGDRERERGGGEPSQWIISRL